VREVRGGRERRRGRGRGGARGARETVGDDRRVLPGAGVRAARRVEHLPIGVAAAHIRTHKLGVEPPTLGARRVKCLVPHLEQHPLVGVGRRRLRRTHAEEGGVERVDRGAATAVVRGDDEAAAPVVVRADGRRLGGVLRRRERPPVGRHLARAVGAPAERRVDAPQRVVARGEAAALAEEDEALAPARRGGRRRRQRRRHHRPPRRARRRLAVRRRHRLEPEGREPLELGAAEALRKERKQRVGVLCGLSCDHRP